MHRLLRLPDVMARTGLKRSQIYCSMKTGDFPQSCKIGPASVAWSEAEVDEWIAGRLSRRAARPGDDNEEVKPSLNGTT